MKLREKFPSAKTLGFSVAGIALAVVGALGAPTASAQPSGTTGGIVISLGTLDQPICGMVSGQLSTGFNFITGGDLAGMLRYDMQNRIPVTFDYSTATLRASANCGALPNSIHNPDGSVTANIVMGNIR